MNLKPFSIAVLLLLVQYTTGFAQANLGFVQHEAAMQPVQTDAAFNALPLAGKQTSRTYYDGMGRIVQQVGVQASPMQNDIIQPVIYDNLGRQTISYLPYAGKSTDAIGSYRASATTDLAAFYNNGTADKVADDTYPYSQQVFENSPLQRLLSVGKVGNGFQPTISGNHYKTAKYRYNSATTDGNILVWNSDGTFTANNFYPDNSLSVTDGIDEDNVETLTYTDIAGHTILKRQILSGVNPDTYYVYNNAGGISFVVPPKATSLLAANSYNLSITPLSNLVFKYLYDNRGRIIEKTVPAKGKISVVYDPLNRPVLIQDASMAAANKWNYIKYDAKNRSISQGIYVDNTNIGRANMQTYVSGLALYNTAWFENRSGAVTNGGYYTNTSFPTTGITPLAYAYFDDYDLNQDGTADFIYTSPGFGEDGATTAQLKNVPTIISQTTVGAGLTNTWLTKVTFYDKRGNAVQVKSNNQLYYTGATALTDTKTVVPNFNGTPQLSLVIKKSSSTVSLTIQTNLTYDHMSRVTAVDQKYNGATAVRVAAYNYNELGQIVEKNLGSTNAGNTSWLQSVDMRYNIRGQLLSINNSKLSNDGGQTNGDTNDLFGMQFLYNNVDANLGNTGYYNGKLSAVKWMSRDGAGNQGNERSYVYLYDAADRYRAANYAERLPSATGAFTVNSNAYNESSVTYDANGNILTLNRNAYISTSGTINAIDHLNYTYSTDNPNQLSSVSDNIGSNYVNFGFRNLTGSTTGTYSYDGNGNMTADPFKGLSIAYNPLNRTDKITVTTSTGRYINYAYDAGGKLIRKQVYDNNVLGTTTDYVDGFVYLNGVISYFSMPEGRVRNTGSGTTVTLKQEYIMADQQGNARISFEDNGSGVAVVRQENSYYGFGLSLPGSAVAIPTTDNKQLYNGGSEWQNDYSNLPDLQQTFYRNYDPALGRWLAVDPVAESVESMSVYQYAGNNPIMMNDPLGDLSQAQWDFVVDQLNNGIDGNYFLKDGQGGGGGGGSLYTRLSDLEAFASVADHIDNGSIRGGWGATAAGSFQAAFNNFTNGVPASDRSDVNHLIPLPEATVTETRNNSNWLIDRLNNANTEGGLLGYANPASFNLDKIADAYYTKIVNPNTNYTYLDLWPLTLRHTDVILPNLYVQVRNIGLAQSQRGIAKAWDLARDVVRRDNIEGLIDDPLEANKVFLYQFRTYLKDLFGGFPIVTPSPFKGAIPETTIKYLPIRTY